MRFRICRKEAKEAALWIRLVHCGDMETMRTQQQALDEEAKELKLIFSAIIKKLEG